MLTASTVGTAVEYYDFYIYATAAALFFGPLFFPGHEPAAQTLLTLSSIGLAFAARPLGAVAFGHFGDRVGRKTTLVASLLLMGGCTLAMALLPTHATIGWSATVLLCVLRFMQGFAVGGEFAGAALLSIENAPPRWKARFALTAPLGTSIGKIMGYGLFLMLGLALSESDMAAWGWRLPFLASVLLVFYGLRIRLRIGETPEFRAAASCEPPAGIPLARLFRDHAWPVAAGSTVVMASNTMVNFSDVFALAQAESLGFEVNAFLTLQLVCWPFGVLALTIGATKADLTSPERTIALGALITIPVGLAFGAGLGSGSLLAAGLAIGAAKCVGAFTVAANTRWMSEMFPVRVRYTGMALAICIGTTMGQAVIPVLAQTINASAGMAWIGVLPAALGVMALVTVRLARTSSMGTGDESLAMARV